MVFLGILMGLFALGFVALCGAKEPQLRLCITAVDIVLCVSAVAVFFGCR